jgi:diacylglycerol kinase (ATP)
MNAPSPTSFISPTVLINPNARQGRAAKVLPAVQRHLAGGHPHVPVHCFDTVPEALAHVRALPVGSRLVVIGGDGTLNQMLPAMLERSLEVGLVAYGSGDDTARAIGVNGMHWRKALDFALTQPTTPFDIAWVNAVVARTEIVRPLPFFSSFSVGFDAHVGRRAVNISKLFGGRMRYFFAGIAEWVGMRYWKLRIDCDGAMTYEGKALMVTSLNTPTYGGGMPIMPNASVNDGLLNLILIKNMSRKATISGLVALALGHRLKRPEMTVKTYRRMTIHSTLPFPVAADGEFLCMATHLNIELRNQVLQVVQNHAPQPKS